MTQTEWLKQNISEVEKLLSRDEANAFMDEIYLIVEGEVNC